MGTTTVQVTAISHQEQMMLRAGCAFEENGEPCEERPDHRLLLTVDDVAQASVPLCSPHAGTCVDLEPFEVVLSVDRHTVVRRVA